VPAGAVYAAIVASVTTSNTTEVVTFDEFWVGDATHPLSTYDLAIRSITGVHKGDLSQVGSFITLQGDAGVDILLAPRLGSGGTVSVSGELSATTVKINTVGHTAGSSFPASPSVGDVHNHTTLRRTAHWDGANWLSEPFSISIGQQYGATLPAYSATAEVLFHGTPGDVPLKFLYWRVSRFVSGTHDASNNWNIKIRLLDAGGASTTVAAQINSWSNTGGGWQKLAGLTTFDAQPSINNGWFELWLEKIGAAGTLQFTTYLRVVEVLG
jgi:hypothetical protein